MLSCKAVKRPATAEEGADKMGCNKPLIRFYSPNNREISGRVYSLSAFFKERLHTDEKPNYEKVMYRKDVMLIPCGQCIGCKIGKREDWVTRMELESRTSDPDGIYFVTLTYNDENIPNLNLTTGEIMRGKAYAWKGGSETPECVQTLWKEDITLFLKRLRKGYQGGIRYFLAGEYGEKTGRPHYHMIIYGWYPTDLTPIHKLTKSSHLTSKKLEEIWGKGNVDIAPATPETYRYVAGYVTKKLYGDDNKYKEWGMQAPYCVMSRMPGLGDEYYNQHKEEIWEQGYITCAGGKHARIPDYYYRKLEEENPERAWSIKRDRQAKVIQNLKFQNSLSSRKYEDTLKLREHKAAKSGKKANGIF